jgi:hypothetical protein
MWWNLAPGLLAVANITFRFGSEIWRKVGVYVLTYYSNFIVVIGYPHSLSRTESHSEEEKTLEGVTISSILTQGSKKQF